MKTGIKLRDPLNIIVITTSLTMIPVDRWHIAARCRSFALQPDQFSWRSETSIPKAGSREIRPPRKSPSSGSPSRNSVQLRSVKCVRKAHQGIHQSVCPAGGAATYDGGAPRIRDNGATIETHPPHTNRPRGSRYSLHIGSYRIRGAVFRKPESTCSTVVYSPPGPISNRCRVVRHRWRVTDAKRREIAYAP
jgi:hypothetical protein